MKLVVYTVAFIHDPISEEDIEDRECQEGEEEKNRRGTTEETDNDNNNEAEPDVYGEGISQRKL